MLSYRLFHLGLMLCLSTLLKLSWAFDYVYGPDTVLVITHIYGLTTTQQNQVKELIGTVLRHDGRVLINFDPKSARDLTFRAELSQGSAAGLTPFGQATAPTRPHLYFIASYNGEMLAADNERDVGLPLESLMELMALKAHSRLYVIGSYFTACHTNTLIDVAQVLFHAKLNPYPMIEVDMNLTVYTSAQYLQLAWYVEDLLHTSRYLTDGSPLFDFVFQQKAPSSQQLISLRTQETELPDIVVLLAF